MTKPYKNQRAKKKSWAGHLRLIAGCGLIVCGLVALRLSFTSSSNALPVVHPTDLISGQDWSHFAGAKQIGNGIYIQALGRAIVNQDGSDNQANPPVNVRGPHLAFSNDIQIQYKTSQIPANGKASFYLYSSVPIIYDEWRYEPPQLRVDLSQNQVTAYQWNGRNDRPSSSKSWNLPVGAGAFVRLDLSKKKGVMSLSVNGTLLKGLKTQKIFNSGNIWFGADNSVGSSDWILKSLDAAPINGSLDVIPAAEPAAFAQGNAQTLRALSASSSRKLPIGAAIAGNALFSDPAYRQLVASQISLLVPENEIKAQFIHPQPNVYSFTDADNLIDFAQSNSMAVRGHNLVFSEANPKWMQTAPLNQRQQIMTDHIKAVVTHFGNKISSWDVVDEPLNDNDDNNGDASDLRQNIWFASMGEKYIDVAFQAAHTANPSAKLYLNEYGLEANGSRWQEFLSLVKRLQARGVPIDGVGFQAHVYEPGDEINSATLKKHIQTLAAMGLKSRISEMDVYGDSPQHQADQYAAALQACLDLPSCTSFTMWGLTDRYGSTTDAHNYPLNYGNDLVWDENMNPKPAYKSLQQLFASVLRQDAKAYL